MKKLFKILFTSISALTLISCATNNVSTEKSNNDSSNIESSLVSSLNEESSLLPSSSLEVESSIEQPSSMEISSSLEEDVYYHVTFLNDDEETVLYEVDVKEGEEAVYQGETPTKEEDDEFTYEFEGWDVDLTNIQSDVTAIAQYKATGKEGWGPIYWP